MPASIQPIVLVGGSSRRFGRDKLREPLGGGWLVDRPIAALREVFGGHVRLVGACHPEVARRGDGVIPDSHPGTGPVGGIVSALEACTAAAHARTIRAPGTNAGSGADTLSATSR